LRFASIEVQEETNSKLIDRTSEGKDNDIDYHCILLDITLPDGNGLAILKKVRAEGN